MLTVKNISKTLDFAKISDLLHFALDGKLEHDVVVNIIEYDHILDRLSTPDFELKAITYPTNIDHNYSLIIRRGASRLEEIVLHESIHLTQYEAGQLKFNVQSGRCEWDGVSFSASFPYEARPWEKEAFRGQYDLLAAWRKHNKKLK